MKLHTKLIYLHILMMLVCPSHGPAAEGIKWNRIKLSPKVSASERYTNNAFLSPGDKREEFITTISPGISVELALSTNNILSLRYDGDFKYYRNFDNFKKDSHRTGLVWKRAAPGGSRYEFGGNANYDSVQPYSIKDRHKDFVSRTLFLNTLLKLGAFTEMGLRYDHLSRRIENPLDTIDEFDSNTMTMGMMYRRSSATVPLIEYTYSHQNNNDISGTSTDMDTHTLFLGVQWDPASRLYGNLKGGYTMTNF